MGKRRNITITRHDLDRLQKLIEALEELESQDSEHLDSLEEELRRARVVDKHRVPPDVVTMNSKVLVKNLDSGLEEVYALTFPGDADPSNRKISVLAPIGTALIGYRVGDVIEWEVPAGKRRLKIMEMVYQPEAEGDYRL